MNLIERLNKITKKKSRRIIGLMSGMSMDGINLACADISGTFPKLKVDLVESFSYSDPKPIRSRLLAGQQATVEEVSKLNVLVAEEFVRCMDLFFSAKGIRRDSIDAIGSHGQTLYHSMNPLEPFGSTLQVGSPSIIAERTGILTIGNFRARDIAAGGQGAPLVSIADYVLFRDPSEIIALNNLGSISNLTIVTPHYNDMLAFDTGPANMAIDFFSRMIQQNESAIDFEGRISKQGKCIPKLLTELQKSPFFCQKPPKAAGYSEFGPKILTELSKPFLENNPNDLVRTAVEFSALTIQQAYREFVLPRFPNLKRTIFSGGGIYNTTLISRIKELLPEITIEVLDQSFADAKEALAFAILANETLSGRAGSLPSTTGISKPTVLGELAL